MSTYQDRIDQNLQALHCPFCSPKAEIIIDKNEHFQVLLARAPYTPDHLLIVPIRHLIYMHELSSDEQTSAMLLINKRMDILHQTYPDINLLLRDGKVNGNIGKSVDHLHFHLIPSITIWGQISKMRHRCYFSDTQYAKLIKDFKHQFLNNKKDKKPEIIHDHSYWTIPYLINQDWVAEFLLIYQKEGFRGFPKGHLETGETPEQAALRELREETWITDCTIQTKFPPLTIFYKFYDRQHHLIHKYANFYPTNLWPACKSQLAIDNFEVTEARRCSYDQALELLTHQNSKNILQTTVELLNL